MNIKTKHFGEIEIEEDKIITFEKGIPGFKDLKKFTLLTDDENDPDDIFYWLQSTEDESVAFVLINMLKIMPDYNPLVPEIEVEALGEYDAETFTFYNIATVPDELRDMTVNLKAPVVINTETQLGKQVVCTNDEYTVRHAVFND